MRERPERLLSLLGACIFGVVALLRAVRLLEDGLLVSEIKSHVEMRGEVEAARDKGANRVGRMDFWQETLWPFFDFSPSLTS